MIASAIGIRQGLMPILMLLAAAAISGTTEFRQVVMLQAAISGTTEFRQVVMLQAAMPVAVFPIVLVRLYDRDTGTALRVVLSTSLAGIVLIPIWLAIGSWWLGV